MSGTQRYDVVIVGAGMCGSLLADQLGARGWRVLVLEAGTGTLATWNGYQEAVATMQTALAKVPNSAYLSNADAPSPSVLDIARTTDGRLLSLGYFEQAGPMPYGSDYLRARGGTMVHWLGICLRMLPEDFEVRTQYGHGRDWPIGYHDLEPWYEKAERAIGVAGDARAQAAYGVPMRSGYRYPMKEIPPSYVDSTIAVTLGNGTMVVDGHPYDLRLTTTPQGRNSTPDPEYDGGRGYSPVGAPGVDHVGERCVGNSSCVPICPAHAKYTPLKTQANWRKENVTLVHKAIVTRVLMGADGRAFGVEYQSYDDPRSISHTVERAEGDIVVLAAHSIENAKLLLASGLTGHSGQVGRNLMDHPVVLSWGLMPMSVGAYRGPGSTSGLEAFRHGSARRDRAAFRVEISNWGWNWATGSPITDVTDAVDHRGLTGAALRRHIAETVPRQVQFQCMVEQPAEPNNRVTIDPRVRDQLGNYRPIIHYELPGYVLDGFAAARAVSANLLARLSAADVTYYDPSAPSYVKRESDGQGFVYYGAGHGAGTHIMGTGPTDSVVDQWQRLWDVSNVYAVGCGSMPSMGTANPSLTMAALALRTADRIAEELLALNRPVTVTAGVPVASGSPAEPESPAVEPESARHIHGAHAPTGDSFAAPGEPVVAGAGR